MLTLKNVHIDLMNANIVDNFDFQLSRGEVACIFGKSGCGKTTLLRAISGLIDVHEGTIVNRFVRTAHLFQEHRLLPWRTAWENIALVNHNADSKQISDLLTQMMLDEIDWKKYPHELSGGMRQRVALARALITEPDLLLMDEPFSALDFELKQSLKSQILDRVHQHSMSIILITHDRYEALSMANNLYLLSDTKPTTCHRVVSIKTPHINRDATFYESHLQKAFRNAD